MKGASELVAGAIMIVIAVTVSSVIGTFLMSSARQASTNITETAEQQVKCKYSDFMVRTASFDPGGDCTSGVNHTLQMTIKNTGKVKMNIGNVYVETSDGKLVNFAINQNISAGDTKTFYATSEAECVSFLGQTLTGYTGRIAAIRISSETCPAADVVPKEYITFANANQTEARPGKYTMGLWHFNNSLDDSSGHNNHGTFGGGTASYDSGVSPAFGTGLRLDGIDDYVDLGDGESLNIQGNLTIEAWIKSYKNNTYVIAKDP